MRGILAYEYKPTHPGPPVNRLFCRDWMYSNYKCKKKQRPEMKNGKQFSIVTDGVMAGGDLYEIHEFLHVSTTSRFLFKIKTVQGGSFSTNAMISFEDFLSLIFLRQWLRSKGSVTVLWQFLCSSIFSVIFFVCNVIKLPSIRVSCSTFLKWHRDEVFKISF